MILSESCSDFPLCSFEAILVGNCLWFEEECGLEKEKVDRAVQAYKPVSSLKHSILTKLQRIRVSLDYAYSHLRMLCSSYKAG